MAVDLLDAPLRLSWDLAADLLNADQLQQIARQLLDAGVFFVALEAEPLQHPAVLPLLETLTTGGCQLSLVLKGERGELALLESIPKSVSLSLDCAAAVVDGQLDLPLLKQRLDQLSSAGFAPSLLWVPRHGELPLILELLDFCAAEKVNCFKLPNQKIGVNSDLQRSFLPDCNDLEQLTRLVRSSGVPQIPNLQLEVHDLFLWELLQPLSGGSRSEYGGCQAANSLGYIDKYGQLFPCASWPQPLGDITQENLLDLWQSQLRMQIRQQITEIPVGCEGCRDYEICFGGCRGLSSFCRDDGLKRDLLCSALR